MNNTQADDRVRTRTVLIVEDNGTVRTALHEWLGASFPHCRFLEAKNGEEAVAMACALVPDVVLMDIWLPEISGLEATRRIKANTPEVQVVMLTIHEGSAYQADAASAGASAYVAKRTMHTELIPVLRTLLSGLSDTGPSNAPEISR